MSAGLLTYGVTPTTVPYTADPAAASVVTLMLTATNETAKVVDCSQLVFRVHAGNGGGDLAADATGVDAAVADGTEWSISGDGAGTFTAVPTTTGELAPGESIAFFLSELRVNGVPGSGLIDVWEESDRLRQPPPLAVAKTPPGLAITRFTASPVVVLPGAKTTLVWTTTGAAGCELSWSGGGSVPVDPSEQYDDYPQETTEYTLTATGSGGSLPQSLSVAVPAPCVVRFDASPHEVALGGASTLAWRIVNAARATMQPLDQDVDARSGTLVVNPTATTLYSLEIESDTGTDEQARTVNVKPVSIDSFTATPATPLWPGDPVTLAWATTWATGCTVDPAVGDVPPSGSAAVAAADKTTYILTAQGLQPQTQTVVVAALPTFQRLEVGGDRGTGIGWTAAADAVNGGPPSGSAQIPIDTQGRNRVSVSSTNELVANRGANRSRIVVQIDFEFETKTWLGFIPGGSGLVPSVVVVADGGLNRPGGQLSFSVRSGYDVQVALAGCGLDRTVNGSALDFAAELASAPAGEPWQLTLAEEVYPEPDIYIRCEITITVFPLEQP